MLIKLIAFAQIVLTQEDCCVIDAAIANADIVAYFDMDNCVNCIPNECGQCPFESHYPEVEPGENVVAVIQKFDTIDWADGIECRIENGEFQDSFDDCNEAGLTLWEQGEPIRRDERDEAFAELRLADDAKKGVKMDVRFNVGNTCNGVPPVLFINQVPCPKDGAAILSAILSLSVSIILVYLLI